MLSDKDYDIQYLPFFDVYNKLETELILKVIQRIRLDGGIGGSAEWYIQKLAEMGALEREVVQTIAQLTHNTPTLINNMIKEVTTLSIDYDTYDKAYALGETLVNIRNIPLERTIEGSYDFVKQQFDVVHTNAVEGATKAYKDIVTKAHLEVTTGVYSYDESIRNSIRALADKGITTATYIRNGKEVKYGMESIVRRNVITGIGQVANKTNEKVVQELQADYIATSEHLGARNKGTGYGNHEQWQGKVYKVDGKDDEYDNFYTQTGYGEITGLGGINCRHIHWAYFPGVSVPIERRIDEEENSRVYELEQKQRGYERAIRRAKRRLQAYEEVGDEVGIQRSKKLIKARQKRIREFINDNKDVDLRRDYAREQI